MSKRSSSSREINSEGDDLDKMSKRSASSKDTNSDGDDLDKMSKRSAGSKDPSFEGDDIDDQVYQRGSSSRDISRYSKDFEGFVDLDNKMSKRSSSSRETNSEGDNLDKMPKKSASSKDTNSEGDDLDKMSKRSAGSKDPNFEGDDIDDHVYQRGSCSRDISRYSKDFQGFVDLGEGSFGKVQKVRHKLDQKIYAVKSIKFAEEEREKTLQEVRILSGLKHPNIIRYHTSWIEEGPVSDVSDADDREMNLTLFIQMECGGRRLLPEKGDYEAMEPEEIFQYFQQIVSAIQYMHANRMIHGDICLNNIFWVGNDIKLIDFGMARSVDDVNKMISTSDDMGTVHYAPPEYKYHGFSGKSDVFSLGVVLMDMLFAASTQSERGMLLDDIKVTGSLPPGSDFGIFGPLLLRMLFEDPNMRPSAEEILKELETLQLNHGDGWYSRQ